MSAQLPNAKQWAERCLNDGEFMLAARYWNGGLTLNIGDKAVSLPINNGTPDSTAPLTGGVIELSASTAVWDKVLAPVPERFHNDIMANIMQGKGMERRADPVVFGQYFAAVARAIELLRSDTDAGDAMAHYLRP